MKTTVEMWAVFDPEGKVLPFTLGDSECECVTKYIYFPDDRYQMWQLAERDGYTCRPVRVTIEEIKNESQRDH
jgi:hypothetical protein